MPCRELQIIDAIRNRSKVRSKEVRLAIGDDCAVLRPRPGHELVVTTDFSIEGTHFRRDWHSARSAGHRCLARGLSDIAAMGAEPIAAFLSLGLPQDLPQPWVDEFLEGFISLADIYKTTLAGGDTSESKLGVVADVVVMGSVPRGRALRRSHARVGDVVYVTGSLGGSAAALNALQEKGVPRFRSATSECERAHFFPQPRVGIGRSLRENKLARAMIDLSDGLSTDLAHLCRESGVGAMISRDLLPIATGSAVELALHGGEDYELLFTASPRAKVPVQIDGIPVTEIGWTTRERDIFITDLKTKPQRLEARGWQHFAKS